MAANTQPIFPLTPVNWHALLSNHQTPRDITTQTPVSLGQAGKNGSLIHTVFVQHLGNNVGTVLRLYQRSPQDTRYWLLAELTLGAITTASDTASLEPVKLTLPDILPSPNKGLHLAPDVSLFVGLGTTVAAGMHVWAIGGNF